MTEFPELREALHAWMLQALASLTADSDAAYEGLDVPEWNVDPDGVFRNIARPIDGWDFRKRRQLQQLTRWPSVGPDIYPGASVLDPNSALSMKAAVAHEISHFHRWKDRTELDRGVHRDLDEGLTSLDAALRFAGQLSPHEIQQLIRDAMQRLQLHGVALQRGSDELSDFAVAESSTNASEPSVEPH